MPPQRRRSHTTARLPPHTPHHEHEREHKHEVHVYIDGREIWANQQTHGTRYNIRNSGGVTGRFTPGQ